MNVTVIAGLLRAGAVLRSHDRRTQDELLAPQAAALAHGRAFAVARSPVSRELHGGPWGRSPGSRAARRRS